jgi:hypothetical protein
MRHRGYQLVCPFGSRSGVEVQCLQTHGKPSPSLISARGMVPFSKAVWLLLQGE